MKIITLAFSFSYIIEVHYQQFNLWTLGHTGKTKTKINGSTVLKQKNNNHDFREKEKDKNEIGLSTNNEYDVINYSD